MAPFSHPTPPRGARQRDATPTRPGCSPRHVPTTCSANQQCAPQNARESRCATHAVPGCKRDGRANAHTVCTPPMRTSIPASPRCCRSLPTRSGRVHLSSRCHPRYDSAARSHRPTRRVPGTLSTRKRNHRLSVVSAQPAGAVPRHRSSRSQATALQASPLVRTNVRLVSSTRFVSGLGLLLVAGQDVSLRLSSFLNQVCCCAHDGTHGNAFD